MTVVRFPRPKLYISLALALCTLAPLTVSSVYYAQNQGVCLKSARVLSDEELRKAVLVNVVNDVVRTSVQGNLSSGNDYNWVGINSPAQETDIKKMITAAYNNGKSFEENFALKVLVAGHQTRKYELFTSDQLIEPFILMTYTPGLRDGIAWFFASEHVKELGFNELNDKIKESAQSEITFPQKLLGYGNHYFLFYSSTWLTFEQECCDNRNHDRDDYMEKKRKAHSAALASITEHAEITNLFPKIAKVSNCGDVLMTTTGRNIHWIGTPFDDEGYP